MPPSATPPQKHPWATFHPPPCRPRPLQAPYYADPKWGSSALPSRASAKPAASAPVAPAVPAAKTTPAPEAGATRPPQVGFKARAIAAPKVAPPAPPAETETFFTPRSTPLPGPVSERVPSGATDPNVDITRAPWMPSTSRPAVSDELANALQKLAAEAAVPISATNAPFYTVAQREAMAHAERRRTRRHWAKRLGLAAAALLVLGVVATQFLFRTPDDEALAAHAQFIASAVLPLYINADQPLRLETATAELRERIDGRHLRYFARVTLRLTRPLYEPGTSNGTVAYRQLQAALGEARTSDLKFKLLPSLANIPTLPPLVQITHRAGDTVVVDVPFTADRSVRRWHFGPPELAKRTTQPVLRGGTYDREGPGGFFVISAPGTATLLRERMVAARKYIIAVAAEEQRRGIVRGDPNATEKTLPNFVLPNFDPDAVAVPDTGAKPKAGRIDPDAPAIDPNAPAVNPDAPAVNPDAPAVPDPNAPAKPAGKR